MRIEICSHWDELRCNLAGEALSKSELEMVKNIKVVGVDM